MVLAHIRKGFWAAVLSLLPCALATAPAGADGSLEYAVKGAYLYKMLPFVDWPQTVLGLSREEFLKLGRVNGDSQDSFGLTPLALRMAR